MALQATRGHHVVHLDQFPSNLRGDVNGVFTSGHLSGGLREDLANIVDKFHMARLRVVDFATNRAIEPLPCILSTRHSCVIRVSGTSPMGKNGLREEVAKNLQVSATIILSRFLTAADGQFGDISQYLVGDGCRDGVGS